MLNKYYFCVLQEHGCMISVRQYKSRLCRDVSDVFAGVRFNVCLCRLYCCILLHDLLAISTMTEPSSMT